MHKPLIASVLAIAIAFSGISAAPARAASREDIAKILAGAATLYIISRSVNNSRNSNARSSRARQQSYNVDAQRSYGSRFPYYDNAARRSYGRQFPDKATDRNRQCLRKKYRDGRWVSYKDQQCLKRYNTYRAEKPRTCLRKRWTRSGWVRYYDRSCLGRNDYQARYRDDDRREHEHRRRHDDD